MQTDQLPPRQLVGLLLAAVLLLIALGLYSARSNTYAAKDTQSTKLTITNPLVLQNWLPPSAYNYTVARLNDYATSQQLDASSITVRSGVGNDQGAYGFTVSFDPDPSKYVIDVLVNNFDSVISTAVSINGATQQITIPTKTGNTSFSDLDSLTNAGLTAVQANDLQVAFSKYDDRLSTVNVDAGSVSTEFDDSTSPPTQLMKFVVSLDGKNYDAVIDYTDLTSINLKLYKADSHDVLYNSGKISSSS